MIQYLLCYGESVLTESSGWEGPWAVSRRPSASRRRGPRPTQHSTTGPPRFLLTELVPRPISTVWVKSVVRLKRGGWTKARDGLKQRVGCPSDSQYTPQIYIRFPPHFFLLILALFFTCAKHTPPGGWQLDIMRGMGFSEGWLKIP